MICYGCCYLISLDFRTVFSEPWVISVCLFYVLYEFCMDSLLFGLGFWKLGLFIYLFRSGWAFGFGFFIVLVALVFLVELLSLCLLPFVELWLRICCASVHLSGEVFLFWCWSPLLTWSLFA